MDKLMFLVIVAIILAAMAIYGYISEKKMNDYIIRKLKKSFGEPAGREWKSGEFIHVPGYSRNHETEFTIDDITWNDLNMDDIFGKLNYTLSSAGEEYLYYLLRNPSLSSDGRDSFEEKIEHFRTDNDRRLALQLALLKCGKTGKYSIYDYLNNLSNIDNLNPNKDYFLLILYALSVAVMLINFNVGIVIFVCVLIYGGVSYFAIKKKIEPYIISFAYVFRLINYSNTIIAIKDDFIREEQDKLKENVSKFKRFSLMSDLVMGINRTPGNPIEIVVEYIRMFFHLDIIKFFQMRNEIKSRIDDIDELITIIGSLDATVAIAMYREYVKDYCVPEFGNEGMKAEGLYHPLLTDPVANDIDLTKGIILTGSNASGKSTMLKTITVAAIMAQSVNTVTAASYSAPAYKIYTSLSLKDDIISGDSYYMREIKALKRIIDAGEGSDRPVLAAVDEVLRGTNTIERIASSYVILKNMSKVKGLVLAATHDYELASMLDELYDNYHFEETIRGNDISFAYKMLKGMATSRNAIKLLEITGYDSEIIREANEMSMNLEKGELSVGLR